MVKNFTFNRRRFFNETFENNDNKFISERETYLDTLGTTSEILALPITEMSRRYLNETQDIPMGHYNAMWTMAEDEFGKAFLSEFPQAIAVWSVQKLSKEQTNIKRTRRSSDNASDDFQANQLTSSMLSFVNSTVINIQPNWTSTTDGWVNFSGGATAAHEASYEDSQGVTRTNIVSCTGGETNNFARTGTTRIPGERYRITGWILCDQLGFFRLRLHSNIGTTITQTDTWTEMDFEFDNTTTGTWNFEFIQSGTAESIFKITDLKIEAVKSNGRTPRWYNQIIPTSEDLTYFNANFWYNTRSVTPNINLNADFYIEFDAIFEDPATIGNTLEKHLFSSDESNNFRLYIGGGTANILPFSMGGNTNNTNRLVFVNAMVYGEHVTYRFEWTKATNSMSLFRDGVLFDTRSLSAPSTETRGNWVLGKGAGSDTLHKGLVTRYDFNGTVLTNNGTRGGTFGGIAPTGEISRTSMSKYPLFSNDLVNVTAANQPSIVRGGVLNVTDKGKPALFLDQQGVSSPIAFPISFATGIRINTVIQNTLSETGGHIIWAFTDGVQSNNNRCLLYRGASSPNIQLYMTKKDGSQILRNIVDITENNNKSILLSVYVDNDGYSFQVNNGAITSEAYDNDIDAKFFGLGEYVITSGGNPRARSLYCSEITMFNGDGSVDVDALNKNIMKRFNINE